MAEAVGSPLCVIEFYSGVGGWHYAIRETGLNLIVLAAIDINTIANEAYRHNFPSTQHYQKNISGITAQELDLLSAHVFTLSPPCQPFTRQGKKEDMADHRTDSFQHLLQVLQKMTKLPHYIMMENVKGFEVSQMRETFVFVLKKIGYSLQEFLVSPIQFGVPNSRLRYYLLARLQPLAFSNSLANTPYQNSDILIKYVPKCFSSYVCNATLLPIANFLEHNLSDEELSNYLIPDDMLRKYAMAFDIVSPCSLSSCCFTRSYYRYAVGTGSILHYNHSADLELAYSTYQTAENKDCVKYLKELQLRYFTPREVANLMCFPNDHKFPVNLTLEQCYRLLGNSVNVLVVSTLLNYLLTQE